MKLSLSVRIAETPAKDRLTIEFDALARLAVKHGYHAICMRPSVVAVNTSESVRSMVRQGVERLGLAVSMATTDIAVPLNNEHGPDSLREIGPHLDVAASLGSKLIRVCMKNNGDIPWARRAADQARERGISLAHQCHTDSLFETVAGSLDVIQQVDRPNFGIIYEPANLMLCGENYSRDAIRQLAPHIMNVYVQNHRVNPGGKQSISTRVRGEVRFDLTPLWDMANGTGVMFADVFAGLGQIEYEGYVTVHQAFAELMEPAEAAEKSGSFLRSMAKFEPPL
jgi:sugar phosphate isomerase/epimerase